MSSSEVTFGQTTDYPEGSGHDYPSNSLPQVGQEVKYFVSELKKTGGSILKLLRDASFDRNVHDLLENYIQEFSAQTFRVAVIGQMKAGKSSFINAFTRRTDLLPTDVNPWTTVITRLHFTGNELSDESADFNFFTEESWGHLAEGGGALRELIDRFLPGFESEIVEEHIYEMRERALQRHGENFYELLGRTHSYDQVSQDLVKQYVCAGEFWNEESEKAGIGAYSDITETANLYLRPDPFSYPTILIDTPGTNDPFFIRDEITCQNLDGADIFIVVLHAQQALTISDLGLLRILQGLNKDRVVIFINRVDQLNDPENDSKNIKRHVEMILRNEFPAVNFPIIFGSAKWGLDAALSQNMDLYRTSGITQVANSISQLMLKGVGRYSISKIISNLSLAVDAVKAVKINKSATGYVTHSSMTSESADSELRAVTDQASLVKEMTSKASHYAVLYEKQLEDLTKSILDSFRSRLNNIILEFTQKEVQNLMQALEKGGSEKVWHCDTMSIRRALENEFLSVCKEAAGKINASQQIIAEALKKLVLATKKDFDTSFIHFYEVEEGEQYLSSLALNHKLALELDNSWWKHWWTKKRKKDEWAEELTELIKRDFFPMAERLVQSARSEFHENVRDSLNNFTAINGAVINILEQEMQSLDSYVQALAVRNSHNVDRGNQSGVIDNDSLIVKQADEISNYLKHLNRQLNEMQSANL